MEELKKQVAALSSNIQGIARSVQSGEAELAEAKRAAAAVDAVAIAALKRENAELQAENLALKEKMRAAAAVFGFAGGGAGSAGSPAEAAASGVKRRAEAPASEAGSASGGGGGGGGGGSVAAGGAASSLSGASADKRGRFAGLAAEEPQPPQNGAAGRPLAQVEVPHRARKWFIVKCANAQEERPVKGSEPPSHMEKEELLAGADTTLGRQKYGIVNPKVSRNQVVLALVGGKPQMTVNGLNATPILVDGQQVSVAKDDGPRMLKHGDVIVVQPDAHFVVWSA